MKWSPDGDGAMLERVPPRIHLLEPPVQHEGLILILERPQQLLPRRVEARHDILVGLDLALQVLEQKQTMSYRNIDTCKGFNDNAKRNLKEGRLNITSVTYYRGPTAWDSIAKLKAPIAESNSCSRFKSKCAALPIFVAPVAPVPNWV